MTGGNKWKIADIISSFSSSLSSRTLVAFIGSVMKHCECLPFWARSKQKNLDRCARYCARPAPLSKQFIWWLAVAVTALPWTNPSLSLSLWIGRRTTAHGPPDFVFGVPFPPLCYSYEYLYLYLYICTFASLLSIVIAAISLYSE